MQMDTFKKIAGKIAYPSRFRSMLIVLSGFGLLAYIYATKQSTSFLAYVAYVLSDYALLILVANSLPAFRKIRRRLETNLYARRWLSEPEYRARTSLYAGLLIDFVYIVFKAVLGIYYRSVWYGAVAVYYVVLSTVRFFLVQNDRKSPAVEQAFRCYRLAGLSMLFLNMAMAGMMIQMIGYGKGDSYPGFVIYASAAYTFYILITAVINAIKFHKHGYNPILSATKMLNSVTALMSLFALQTTILTQFGTDSNFNRLMNTATGSAVTALTIGMSAFMIFRGNRALNELREGRVSDKP